MNTITNNKLPDERVSNATLIRLIQWADQHNSHYVAAALCELQERRKADSAPPAQIVSIPDDWQTCEKLSDDSYVDNALRELVEDTTGDNGVRVVQAVIRAFRDSGLIHTYPDLSQPVDPQVSEYEKIMLQVGWVMVPVEPTDEMIAAALDSHLIVFNPVKTYSVMLAAAPQPEALDGK
ncbi:hypothetical protein LPE90_001566 [Salmonella enterica]|nr:hypothetical protein [Salmonella enterica]EIN4414969.1 hypothetical protein [Salmonella enterica]EJY5232583.1 hypothetical protein [Salmonella enterica]